MQILASIHATVDFSTDLNVGYVPTPLQSVSSTLGIATIIVVPLKSPLPLAQPLCSRSVPKGRRIVTVAIINRKLALAKPLPWRIAILIAIVLVVAILVITILVVSILVSLTTDLVLESKT